MGNRDNYGTYIMAASEKHGGYAGGIFFQLARKVIEHGGVAIGAAYVENFDVKHIEVERAEELERITGIKYAESYIDEKLKKKIKVDVQSGRTVLFAGTPCQVRGIRQYLNEDYKNFYTVSVRCSGVIRAQIWKDYINETQSNGSVITEIHYPYRGEFGISQTKALIKFSHGTAYFRDEKEDRLLRLKNAGIIYKEECYRCTRQEDIETDIFLEIYYDDGKRDAEQEDGLTKVFVYTDKGKRLLLDIGLQEDINQAITMEKEEPKLHKIKLYNYFWRKYDNYEFTFLVDLTLLQIDKSFGKKYLLKFLKQYAVLDSRGFSLEKILENWGLKEIILYGAGIVCDIIKDKLEYSGRICAVIDRNRGEEGQEESPEFLEKLRAVSGLELPILIPPGYFIPDVVTELGSVGISPKRVLPIALLTSGEYDNKILQGTSHTVWSEEYRGIGTIYLITGAQFGNKGAQSMLFTAVSELRKKHPECDIYYLPIDSIENYPDSILAKYRFHIIRDQMELYGGFYDLIPQLTAIVDVSGYALSSKWNCGWFVQILLVAKNNNIPIYLMPQSFGPFGFESSLERKVKGGLLHATVIFSREKTGYDLLVEKYGLENVRLSKDLVLQNKDFVIDNIYMKNLELDDYKLDTDNNVAIVPNIRNYEFGNRGELLQIYKKVISQLLNKGKNIYIVSHSDDEQACNDIYTMFSGQEGVFRYEKKLDCLEYCVLVREFQYIIASRYHAIVHAYKKGIPCVAIGWAEKYRELLELFGQEKYVFDVRCKINSEALIEAVNDMDITWSYQKEKIRKVLPVLQAENCFDIID